MWYFSLKVKWYIYIWSPFHCIATFFNVHQLEFFSHDRIGDLTHCSNATYEIITSLGEFLLSTNFTACTHLNVQVLHYHRCGQSNKDRMTGNFSLFLPHLDWSLIIIMLEFPIQFLHAWFSFTYFPFTQMGYTPFFHSAHLQSITSMSHFFENFIALAFN